MWTEIETNCLVAANKALGDHKAVVTSNKGAVSVT